MMRSVDIRLEWLTEYRDGERVVEEQHDELHKRLNDVFQALKSKETWSEIMGALALAEESLRSHLIYEEGLMHKHHYPHLGGHLGDHQKLLEQFAKIKIEFRDPQTRSKAAVGLTSLFFEVFATHMKEYDDPLNLFVKKQVDS